MPQQQPPPPPIAKKRPRRPVEPLDWRDLASGPALRGLSDVLGTTGEEARQRAARRMALDGTAVVLAVPDTPTVGDSPASTGAVRAVIDVAPAEEPATEVAAPTVGVTPPQTLSLSEGFTPTQGELPSVGLTVNTSVTDRQISPGELPTEISSPPVAVSPTVGVLSKDTGWIDADGVSQEPKRVHRVDLALQSMTLGEERFYHGVWQAREADGVTRESPRAKVFSMGYDRLARLVRLDEKSVRQLIPKLVAKKIVEVLAAEDSAARIGKTYRIFSLDEVLERQRAAELRFIIKRGRAVEFVWPRAAAHATPTAPVSPSVGVLQIQDALRCYADPDEHAARAIFAASRRVAPDADVADVVRFIHEKGQAAQRARVSNTLAYLIVTVPKCFEQRQGAASDAAVQLAAMRAEWSALIANPAATEEDRRRAEQLLAETA